MMVLFDVFKCLIGGINELKLIGPGSEKRDLQAQNFDFGFLVFLQKIVISMLYSEKISLIC